MINVGEEVTALAGTHQPDGAGPAGCCSQPPRWQRKLERELIRERPLDGLRAAAAAGRRGGGRPR